MRRYLECGVLRRFWFLESKAAKNAALHEDPVMAKTALKLAPNKTVRILIVDDHPLVRRGLRDLIGSEPDWEVCGEADGAPEAMALVGRLHPDLVLIDI